MGLIQSQNLTGQRKNVAIAGYGVEGEAIYHYLLRTRGGELDITILDQKTVPSRPIPEGVATDLRPDVFDSFQDFDEVWRASPAIPPYLIKTDGEIKTMTQEFFRLCPAKIIGVTGTKGKGTTATLVHKILDQAGLKSHLIGNIGVPVLEVLPEIETQSIVIFELSSFQLWDLKQSPATAVVLMIEPEHLDVHKDVAEYIQAKTNITRWQGPNDLTIYHPVNELSALVALVGLGKKRRFLTKEAAYIEDGSLKIGEQQICSVNDFNLIGQHNHENIAAAVSAAWQYTQNIDAISQAIKIFSGLPHRLQVVRVVKGVKYIDDSISTTPSSAIAAIRAFSEPKILILGGSDKGADYSQLAQEVKRSNINQVFITGATAQKIRLALDNVEFTNFTITDSDMSEIINQAQKIAKPGDVVVLSPACASFDKYQNYIERGEAFKKAVESLNK